MRNTRWLVLLALVIALCSLSPHEAVAPVRLAASTGSWPVYHGNDAHTGYDSTLPPATGAITGWVSPTLDGDVYASPLVFGGVVYAATLNGTVYALSQSTGTVNWAKNVAAPQTGGWVCGNTTGGILSTPVIDTSANRLYAVSEVAGSTPTYHLFGLDLGNAGNVVLNTTIAIPGFDWTIQQQRGAIAVRNGFVYVPFGGRAGDCGSYHGYVVGVPTNGSTSLAIWKTPNTGIGIWTAGGVVIDDVTGNVFATTGNGSCSTVDFNDAVVRFTSGVVFQDYFMPFDWQSMCSADADLGGASGILISPNLMLQAGKSGSGYLLNPNNLGHVDGQLFPAPSTQADVCHGNTSDATFGSFAYAAPYVYLECDGHGLVALNVNTGAPSFTPCTSTSCTSPDWAAGGTATFGPPIVAGGVVWAATSGGGLYGFDAASGLQVFHSAGFNINRFVTPAEAGGQIFVPAQTVIRSFDMTFLNWTSLGGILVSGPDASSWSTSRIDVFGEGQDQALWQKTWNGTTWSSWSSLGGAVTADPGAVSWSANRIDVFVRGVDGALWHRAWDGTMWWPWEGLGGQLAGGPDVASWGANRLDVFVTGSDHALWHRAWDGTMWWPWESLGGYLTSSPSAVSWASGRIDIFGRGSDSQLWHNAWTGSSWYGWQPLGGVLTSAPDAASCASGRLDVLVLGNDSALWRRSWNGSSWSSWSQVDPTSWTADPSTVCSPGSSSLNLVERSSDRSLWTASVTGTI